MAEMLEIIDDDGNIIGRAARKECHRDPRLAHRAVHVLIIDNQNRLVLQKRSSKKEIQPGKWDTSVGGHLAIGESYIDAARRESAEELGIVSKGLIHIHDYWWRTECETELVRTFLGRHDGPYIPHPTEIDDLRPWTFEEIADLLGRGIFTPNFEEEYHRYENWIRTHKSVSPT